VPADVEQMALRPNGLTDGMRPDTAFFDMSTNSVATERWAAGIATLPAARIMHGGWGWAAPPCAGNTPPGRPLPAWHG
jgi:hypothetical protein